MQKRDYYEILGIDRDSSLPEIKKAYRRLAHKYHPDRNKESDAENKFKEVSEAYEVLNSTEKRKNYDTYGHNAPQVSGWDSDWNNFDPLDMFSSFFGGTRRRQSKGQDANVEIQITLEDVLQGIEKNVEYNRKHQCSDCKGVGGQGSNCSTCGGYGKVQQQSGFIQMVTTCPQCHGSKINITQRCKQCNGKGEISEKRTIVVKIPPGVYNGTKIRVTGEGHILNASALPGDLLCFIRIQPHSQFNRLEKDLQYINSITFVEACLGAILKIPTLDGKEKELRIPPGTQFGQVFRIEGHGVPELKQKKNRGDLYVKIQIEVPKNLNSEAKKTLERFDEIQQNAK